MVETVALIMFSGVVIYAVFGGADFGVGFWDLTAGGPRRGAPLRHLIDRSIGPVWEANHVWLIFVLVYLWTGFPTAFASIMETLWIPFSLAGLGIVLRGAAFAFRKFSPTVAHARFYGALFAVSSVVTPFFFGAAAGAIASGAVPANGVGDPWESWTTTTPLLCGVLAVVVCAFIAAVFLACEAARDESGPLVDACRIRALVAAVVAGAVSLALLAPLSQSAPEIYEQLTGRGLLAVIVSMLAGVATLALLYTRRFAVARITAALAVASVVAGWGVAQYPWILGGNLSLSDAAGANATLVGLVVVFVIAAVTVVPALGYLYWVTQRSGWLDKD